MMLLGHEMTIFAKIRPGPHVTQLFGVCTDGRDGKPRIVMELCEHGTLRQYLSKTLPRDKVLYKYTDIYTYNI